MEKIRKIVVYLRYFYLLFNLHRNKNFNVMEECVVLGNGPSLQRTFTDGLHFFDAKKIICVNNFSETEFFEKIKPEFYVLADPIYWEKAYDEFIDNFNNDKNIERSRYFEALSKIKTGAIKNIIDKTTWAMELLVPLQSKSTGCFDEITKINKNITINYYSTFPIELNIQFIRHLFYRCNFGMPTPQNVLIPAIFLALNHGFKKIILVGADHSWHEELVIDGRNVLGTYDKHFYDANKQKKIIPLMKDINAGVTTKVHEQFYALYKVFKSHVLLNKYARYKRATIVNFSKVSWIDAYSRVEGNGD
jgi:hypothetical protein